MVEMKFPALPYANAKSLYLSVDLATVKCYFISF